MERELEHMVIYPGQEFEQSSPEQQVIEGDQLITINRYAGDSGNNKNKNLELESSIDTVVCIFSESKKLGIKFRVIPSEQDLYLGIFQTTPSSISTAEWNEEVNSRNNPMPTRHKVGETTFITYIVPDEVFLKIMSDIIMQMGNSKVIINTFTYDLEKNSNNSKSIINNKQELEQMKDTLLNKVQYEKKENLINEENTNNYQYLQGNNNDDQYASVGGNKSFK